jgi:hypothetical protein
MYVCNYQLVEVSFTDLMPNLLLVWKKLCMLLDKIYWIIIFTGRVCFGCYGKDGSVPLYTKQTRSMKAEFDTPSTCTQIVNKFWRNLVLRLGVKNIFKFHYGPRGIDVFTAWRGKRASKLMFPPERIHHIKA